MITAPNVTEKRENMEIDNFYIEEGNCECMKNTEMISLIIITIILNNTVPIPH